MLLFEKLHRGGRYRDPIVFLEAVAACVVGIGGGLLLFPGQASLVGVFLVAFVQSGTVMGLLDRNRIDIWEGHLPPGEANWRLARSLMCLFAGVFLTYALIVQLAPADRLDAWFSGQLGAFAAGSVEDIAFGPFGAVLSHNGLVLVSCFLFALFYRHGGMLLVLAWNASRWGVIFSFVALTARDSGLAGSLGYLGKTVLCVLPHMGCEAFAYVLVAMSGVFLSKALGKYRLSSPEFAQVGGAVLRIATLAAACLVLAALLESFLTPRLVLLLF